MQACIPPRPGPPSPCAPTTSLPWPRAPNWPSGGGGRGIYRRQLEAGRWQRLGRAIVLHNGPLTRRQGWRAALVNCGPRAALTSFTTLECLGLTGWARDDTHVLAPAGVGAPSVPGLAIRLHRTSKWSRSILAASPASHRSTAAVIAASSFAEARPAVGLLAATVQQRLARPIDLHDAVAAASRTRHRAAMLAALDDIAMGARALGEIDFIRLCRRHGLPEPALQAVRREPGGRRRYLDAEWRLPDGRVVAVEVDGAIHLAPRRWFDDQLRQNELSIAGTTVLRYPSVVVREEERLVADQLRRVLMPIYRS